MKVRAKDVLKKKADDKPKPRMQLAKSGKNGKPAIEVIIYNSYYGGSDFVADLDRLGVIPSVNIANRRSIICATARELGTIRASLIKYFDAKGNWLEQEQDDQSTSSDDK